MAFSSCSLDRGENAVLEGWDVKKGDEIASEVIVVVNNVVLSHTAVGIDPEEPPNMRHLVAFE